nr:PEP-CTERM sorting domain-containing protein [Novosphingobium silvae]
MAATPAHAAGGIPLPEPSSLLLLAMGVVGVAVGRRLSSKRRED